LPANTAPIFSVTPNIAFGNIATANTAKDGTGTVATVYTAGANGSRVERIKALALGTIVQTVLRVFINNGSGNNIATNNSLIAEVTIPAVTNDETASKPLTEIIFTNGLVLPAGFKLNIAIGTTVASSIQVTAVGGDY
jgi:hypothetical protein